MGSRSRTDETDEDDKGRAPGPIGSAVGFFVRAVVYGFGVSLGTALFKKVQDRIGLGEPKEPQGKESEEEEPAASEPSRDAAPDPDLSS